MSQPSWPELAGVVEHRRAGEDHRHRVGDVLAQQRRRGAVRGLGHHGLGVVVLVEREQHRLGARDRAEHRHHEVGEAVAVAVEGGDHERRVGRAADQAGVGGVDQHRGVGHLGVPLRRLVELLLQHPLVHRAHRPLRPAVHAAVDPRGGAEAVLGHRAADAARDPLGAERDLVAVLLLAALLGAVRVADRHANDGDRVVDAGHRRHARYAPPGPDDHLAVDGLAQQPVRAAHVVLALGRDRGRLEAEARLAHGRGGLVTTSLLGLAAVVEREVEVLELELDLQHLGIEHAQRLLEQLLTGFVALEDDNPQMAPAWRRNLQRAAPGAATRSNARTAGAPRRCRARGAPRSAGSSTSSRGGSRARTGKPGEIEEPSGMADSVDTCSHCGERARRRARAAGPPPRRAPDPGRLLLRRSHVGVGEGRRRWASADERGIEGARRCRYTHSIVSRGAWGGGGSRRGRGGRRG